MLIALADTFWLVVTEPSAPEGLAGAAAAADDDDDDELSSKIRPSKHKQLQTKLTRTLVC